MSSEIDHTLTVRQKASTPARGCLPCGLGPLLRKGGDPHGHPFDSFRQRGWLEAQWH